MRVFYARAKSLSAGAPERTALVAADDLGEAQALLKADPRFAGYRMPPLELTDGRDIVAAAARLAGADLGSLTKGVHCVSDDV
jgi:hypothetical protein